MSNWKKYLRFKQIIFNSTMTFLAILNFSCFLIVFVHSLGHTKTSERLKLVCCGLYCVVLGFVKCFVLRYDEVTCGVVWIVVVVVILSMVCWESFRGVVWRDEVWCGLIQYVMLWLNNETGQMKDFGDCWSSSLFDQFSCLFFCCPGVFCDQPTPFDSVWGKWFPSSCQSPASLESF